jgi:hypothetical protein
MQISQMSRWGETGSDLARRRRQLELSLYMDGFTLAEFRRRIGIVNQRRHMHPNSEDYERVVSDVTRSW